jgi:hypothetical protein
MAEAETNRAKFRYSKESSWGETPSGPAMTEGRITSESLHHNKRTERSREIRADRMTADHLELSKSASGDVNTELTYGDHEAFYESVFNDSMASTLVTAASTNIAASALISNGSDFTNFLPGQNVRIHGSGISTVNNGAIVEVVTASTHGMTVKGTTLAVETGVSCRVNGRRLRNSTTEVSLLEEVEFTDVSATKYFTGMVAERYRMDARSQSIISQVFSFMGKRGFVGSTTVASTTATATSNTPMTAAVNVARIAENDTTLDVDVNSLSLSISNNLRGQSAVGSQSNIGVGAGSIVITGDLQLYFENTALYEKYVDHTSTSLSFTLKDTDGNAIVVNLPKVYIDGGNPDATGLDADVFLPATYTAVKDPTTDIMVNMDFLPATP